VKLGHGRVSEAVKEFLIARGHLERLEQLISDCLLTYILVTASCYALYILF